MTAAMLRIVNVRLWNMPGPIDVLVPVCSGRLIDDGGATAGVDGSVITVNGMGYVLAPGFHDPHVHFRDPGQTAKETMVTGAAAAASGGYTTVLIMPNTVPALDGAAVDPSDADTLTTLKGRWSSLDYLENYEEDNCVALPVRYALCASASKDRAGAEASKLRDWQHGLHGAGFKHPVVALSDDGAAVTDGILDTVAKNSIDAGIVFIDHCEHHDSGVMNEGETSRKLGLPGIPAETEATVIARDIDLARRTGCHVHLQHVSCAASFDLIRKAKAEGLPVTCETAPHYIALNDTAVERLGTLAKMNPPLRSEENRQATLRAIADGTVDMIATDHAPHTAEEKAKGMMDAPNGIIGLETAYAVCHTVLVDGGVIDDERLIELMSLAPARLMGSAECTVPRLDAGSWERPVLDLTAAAHIGTTTSEFQSSNDTAAVCDFTLLAPREEWTVDPEAFHSKARNTPFGGMHVTGRPMATIIGSRLVFSRIPRSRIMSQAAPKPIDTLATETIQHR